MEILFTERNDHCLWVWQIWEKLTARSSEGTNMTEGGFPWQTWRKITYRIIEDSRKFFATEPNYEMLEHELMENAEESVRWPHPGLGYVVQALENNTDTDTRMPGILPRFGDSSRIAWEVHNRLFPSAVALPASASGGGGASYSEGATHQGGGE